MLCVIAFQILCRDAMLRVLVSRLGFATQIYNRDGFDETRASRLYNRDGFDETRASRFYDREARSFDDLLCIANLLETFDKLIGGKYLFTSLSKIK